MAGKLFRKDYLRGGNIFGEGIERRSTKPRREAIVSRPRWLLCFVLILVVGILGIGRILDLQILRGSYYRGLSDGNRIRRIPIRAARGEILDRKGESLARNIPVYKLAEFSSGGVVISTVEITREEALNVQAENGEEAGRLLVDIKREYPLKEAAAHLVGYTGEASPDEVGQMLNAKCQMPNADQRFALGDLIGRMGIEQYYDCVLRGVNGEELIEVDTRGRLIRRLGRREAVPGKNITLEVDSGLQKAAYEALKAAPELAERVGGVKWVVGQGVRGAVAAQDPNTGGILALVSVPSFDPSTIAQDYNLLSNDKNLPLFNRAIGGAYHPGSIFKIVTTAAAFEDGKIDENFSYIDTGVVTVNNFTYKNWYFTQYGRTEGEIDTVRAIARST
ncbi:MAG: penicillin-binding transpeptidase domain-containing protein, partial [Patescibacteria group bacterium]